MKRSEAPHHVWLSKSLAGALLGYGLAIALSGLFAWIGPDGVDPPNKYQFTMWIVPPIWLGIASIVFLFRSALSAWVCLALANIVAYGFLFFVRQISG